MSSSVSNYASNNNSITTGGKSNVKGKSINELVNNNGNTSVNNTGNSQNNNTNQQQAPKVEKPSYVKSIFLGTAGAVGAGAGVLGLTGVIEIGAGKYVAIAVAAVAVIGAIAVGIYDKNKYEKELKNLKDVNNSNNRAPQRQ